MSKRLWHVSISWICGGENTLRFVLFLIIYLLLSLYVGWNGSLAIEKSSFHVSLLVYWCVYGVVSFAYVLARIKVLPGVLRRFLKVIGSYYFAVFEFALLLSIPADVVGFVFVAFGVSAQSVVPVLAATVTGVMFILLLVGSWNAWVPVIRKYEITVHKHTERHDSLRIVAASDIHLGNLVGKRHLEKFVHIVQEISPHLVLLPGDVLDGDLEPFERNGMADTLRRIRAPYGVFAVLGNHEYYEGQATSFVEVMDRIGIRVLQDEAVCVDNTFYVVGRKDKTAEASRYGGSRLPWKALLGDIDLSCPVIAMDHQPLELSAAQTSGVDVLLCGHTHRGQFAPNHWLTRKLFEIDWGFLRKGALHVMVSSGFGTWGPPIRLASQSEILDIQIHFV